MDSFSGSLSAVPGVNLCAAHNINVFSVHYIIYCIVVAEIRRRGRTGKRTTAQYEHNADLDSTLSSAIWDADEFMYDFYMLCWRII